MKDGQIQTVLVTIAALYVQCRFNSEILTSDATPFSPSPIWDTDLAWAIRQRPLAFLRSQRAKLKLVVYALDARNKRTQIGYIMLDLRTAAATKQASLQHIDTENAYTWYSLICTASGANSLSASPFKPEIKLAFSVVDSFAPSLSPAAPNFSNISSYPSSVPTPLNTTVKRVKNLTKSLDRKPPVLLQNPSMKAIRVQLFPDVSNPPSPTHIQQQQLQQQSQNTTLFTTTSGLPIELTPTGCYQIGFNGPNWLLNFTIAFAENLILLDPTAVTPPNPTTTSPPPEQHGAEIGINTTNDRKGKMNINARGIGVGGDGYYFSYTFLGNTVATTPFADLENPVFPSERITFRVRASRADIARFLVDVDVLVICLCTTATAVAVDGSSGNNTTGVLGFAEVPIADVMDTSGGNNDDEEYVNDDDIPERDENGEGRGEGDRGSCDSYADEVGVVEARFGRDIGNVVVPKNIVSGDDGGVDGDDVVVSMSRSQSPTITFRTLHTTNTVTEKGNRRHQHRGNKIMTSGGRTGGSHRNPSKSKQTKILEKVVTFYDVRQELPVSVDGRVAGLGVSVVLMPDLQADYVEGTSTVGVQRVLMGDEDGSSDGDGDKNGQNNSRADEFQNYQAGTGTNILFQQATDVISGGGISSQNAKILPDLIKRRVVSMDIPDLSQTQPTQQRIDSPDLATDGLHPQSAPYPTQKPVRSFQDTFLDEQCNFQLYSQPKSLTQWHQYRFSIDLQTLFNINVNITRPLYLKYTYAPFGTISPVTTHPPVAPTRQKIVNSIHSSTLSPPHSFCAFEFVMTAERLLTYLEAVPLSVEVWCGADRYEKDVQVGLATVDLSIVCTSDGKVLKNSAGNDKDILLQNCDATVAVVAYRDINGGVGEETILASDKKQVVKIAELKVVLSLEDFGAVEDQDLIDDHVPDAPSMQLEQTMERGPSPTFTRVTRDIRTPTTSTRHNKAHSPTPSSSSSGKSASIHETREYRAALEVALWKKEEMQKFKAHLTTLEKNLVAKLTSEFQKRDATRVQAVAQRVQQLEGVERATRTLLADLETREYTVRKAEDDAQARRNEIERHFARRDGEIEDTARRLGEEFRTRVEIERVKALEAEAARLRAVRERDEVDAKLKSVEADFDAFRKSVIAGKNNSATGDVSAAAAVAAVKTELVNVMTTCAATERRAEALDSAKKHYKIQWIRALRELAKTKKALQTEIEDRFRKSQRELDSVKLRLHAKEEIGQLATERKLLDEMKREIAGLKSNASGHAVENTVQDSSIHGEKEKSEIPVLKNNQKENMNPRVVAEVERLVKERDSLVDTGIYTREDRLIRELDSRIGRLLKS
ncbi:hypothetical protein HK100_001241 [Physocladia obscura]|uniref:DUF3668 domain-containing protein n=1 Tax=Physocladia obscura TaxID=109957 RepID=A0AAD5XLM2_9FUNG|nr:hypothetical protein HK100_001241 [Physocladia obscura]